MNLRLAVIVLGLFGLMACGLGSFISAPALDTPTPRPLPPTPSQGGQTRSFEVPLADLRIGESGGSCGPVAADLKNQVVAGMLGVFPNANQTSLRAVVSNGVYHGRAALLGGDCQPSGTSYNLTASFDADYSATLGQVSGQRCLKQSSLNLNLKSVQGLPEPLGALAQSLVPAALDQLARPRLDELIVRQVNGGRVPAAGPMCP